MVFSREAPPALICGRSLILDLSPNAVQPLSNACLTISQESAGFSAALQPDGRSSNEDERIDGIFVGTARPHR
jgi:hypothetical protein